MGTCKQNPEALRHEKGRSRYLLGRDPSCGHESQILAPLLRSYSSRQMAPVEHSQQSLPMHKIAIPTFMRLKACRGQGMRTQLHYLQDLLHLLTHRGRMCKKCELVTCMLMAIASEGLHRGCQGLSRHQLIQCEVPVHHILPACKAYA